MEKKKHLFGVVFMVVCLCASEAPAFDPMGPPTAGLKKGELRVGVEYMFSNMDIKADGIPKFGLVSTTIENVESNKIYANLGSGLTDDLEIFLRLGGAGAKPDNDDNADNVAGYIGSGNGFAIGGGTKITFLKSEDDKVKWGMLAQMSWANLDFDGKSYSLGGVTVASVSAEVDLVEAQIAAGPTVKLTEGVSIYGGPFLHFINGDADLKGSILGVPAKGSVDLEQDSIFGGYIGAQLDLKPGPTQITKGLYLFGEFQFTGDAWGFGTGFGYKF